MNTTRFSKSPFNRISVSALICFLFLFVYSCNSQDIKSDILSEYIPEAPDYENQTMWFTQANDKNNIGADVFYIVSTWEIDWATTDGKICHYADVWNKGHRDDMLKEISKVAEYMGEDNDFYSPFYRHTTIEAWATQNEDTISKRTIIPMNDVKKAFDYFINHRAKERPFILAGFSQGGKAVVELLKYMDDNTSKNLVAAYVLGYKVTPNDTIECKRIKAAQNSTDFGVTICYNTVKDTKYICPVISAPCAMCINPVNWKTDETPATLHDSITVSVDTQNHVLVVKGYSGSEYHPILNFINVGDIHSCEPWLYSECIKKNIAQRTKEWRKKHNI